MVNILLIIDGALLLILLIFSLIRFGVCANKEPEQTSSVKPVDYKNSMTAEEFANELAAARERLNQEAGKEVVAATEEPAPEEVEVVEESVSEEVQEEIVEVPEVVEVPVEEETLVIADIEDEEDDREIVRRVPFCEKMLAFDIKTQEYYDVIHNEFKSYRRINPRISSKGVSYRLGRELVAKITLRGKTMKLHLALDFNDFEQNIFFQKDMSSVKTYAEVPFTVKVKSDRGLKNALKLVTALAEKKEIIKKSRYERVDALQQLKDMVAANCEEHAENEESAE